MPSALLSVRQISHYVDTVLRAKKYPIERDNYRELSVAERNKKISKKLKVIILRKIKILS